MNFTQRFVFAVLLPVMILTACEGEPVQPINGEGMFPASSLDDAKQYAINQTGGSALIIWHDGDILVEEYQGVTGQTPLPILGSTKSFSGMIAAFGARDGLLSYDEQIGHIIPNWGPVTERGRITVRELLNLTSGLRTAPAGVHQNQSPQVWSNSDMEFARGTTFSYGPTPFYILSWIYRDFFQINPIVYLNQNLFEPLGLNSWSWDFQLTGGYPNLSFGLNISPTEWLQVGRMLLNRGTLNGVEVLTPSQVDQMLVPAQAAPGYSASFWQNSSVEPGSSFINRLPESIFPTAPSGRLISDEAPSDLFMMAGNFGQRLYIIPSLDLVIVRQDPTPSNDVELFNDHEFFTRLFQESQ